MAGQTAAEFLPQKGAKYEMSQGALITANRPHTHPVTHPTVRNLTQRLLDATLANCDEGISQAMQGLPVCWWRNMHAIFAPDGNALAPHRACGGRRLFEDRDLDVRAHPLPLSCPSLP